MAKTEISIISESNVELEGVDYADIRNNDDRKKKLATLIPIVTAKLNIYLNLNQKFNLIL